jgi:hypothetical protein
VAAGRGIETLRILVCDVLKDFNGVMRLILAELAAR